jgi:hypothetical protein
VYPVHAVFAALAGHAGAALLPAGTDRRDVAVLAVEGREGPLALVADLTGQGQQVRLTGALRGTVDLEPFQVLILR